MTERVNRVRSTNLSFLLFLVLLLFAVILLSAEIKYNQSTGSLYGFPLAFFVILIVVSVIMLRGLTYRIRYSFYGAVTLILLAVAAFGLGGLYRLVYSYPLMAASVYSFYMLIKNNKYYNFPTRLFDKPELTISLFIILSVLIFGIIGSMMLGDDFKPAIHSISTAFYYTGVVVTTLGFGDILPVTETSRIFTVVLSLLGLGSFFGAVTIIIAPFMYTQSKSVIYLFEKLESKRLENYILFVGFSPSLELALGNLLEEKELVVVGLDNDLMEKSLQSRGAFVEVENTLEESIKSFDLNRAKFIVLASNDDGENVLNAIHINSAYPQEVRNKMVSLVNSPKNASKLKPLVSETIDPSVLISQSIKSIISERQ